MPKINPFGSLMEVDRYIEGEKQKQQARGKKYRQQEKTNALADMRARNAASSRAFQPVPMVNPEGDVTMGMPTFSPTTGMAGMQPLNALEGFGYMRETPEEKANRSVDVAQQKADIQTSSARNIEQEKVTGRTIAQRLGGQIDTAYESITAVPILKRSLDLMEMVETGGIDAVKLKAKQFLGVESGDEAELTQNLSKAVLKQLKPTFGAQFTKAEGDFLKSIEAGLGKSTAGNKRILQRALKIYERGTKRGMRAARRQGDMETYRELEKALEYTVDTNDAPQPTQSGEIKFLGFE